MSDVSARIAALSPERRELLQRRLLRQRPDDGAERIPPRGDNGPCPLSYPQSLMWLSSQFATESSVYNTGAFLRLGGDLDISALRRTLDTILVRHAALRTNFVSIEGAPAQVVREIRQVELKIREVASGSIDEQEAEIQRLCLEEARQPFNLAGDRLFRTILLSVNSRYHVLILLTHHIVFDGASRKILYRELQTLYSAFCFGRENPLPPLPIQYTDFACWQRGLEYSARLQPQLAYWKKRLAGAPQVLDLPADRLRPAAQTFRGERQVTFSIAPLIEKVRPVAAREGATLFMMFMAVFNVLLFRYTGVEDILVGTPLLGRLQPEAESLIGYFSNTLVIRTDLSGDPSFRELLGRVRTATLEAFDHQEVPLEMLTRELQPERSLNRNPIFQVMASLGEERVLPPELPGLEVGTLRVDRGISKLDLTMAVSLNEDRAGVLIEYRTDLFDADRMARLLGHIETLTAAAAADPDRNISRLRMLPENERTGLLAEGAGPRVERPCPGLVHQLFERQAEMTPDATAVEAEEGALTYHELNARANRIARRLQRRGMGCGSRVGLFLERSPEMIAGLLGILKSGAACVPLDVLSPRERLAFFVRDAELSVVLTQASLVHAIRELGAEPVCPEGDFSQLDRESGDDPSGTATPDGPAYVIYTSGSTGQPKGVLLTHRGLVNHNLFAVKRYGLCPSDRMLMSSPIGFDISIEEIFPVLASGGAVVVRPRTVDPGGHGFLDWLRQRRISVLDLPTAFWHEWTRELSAFADPLPASLRLVIVGGEKAQSAALRSWREKTQDRVRWINTYGPTEASVIATSYEPGNLPVNPDAEIPIGRAIDNVRLYILDQHLEPVPSGITGELYIGGDGVALGYLGQPELTEARFVPDPFGDDPAARLFKTGDRARYRADGEIEFAGRIDHQVKVRGYRVEPGEIESVILQYQDVGEAAVLNRGADGAARLVAYVAGKPGARLDVEDLRRFARDRLPDYMMPAAFVTLSHLPKTARGKLDREALPMTDLYPANANHSYVGPRDEVELQLVKIWERLLGVAPIGMRDGFFELGGHSLLAMSLFVQIAKVFGMTLPLGTLFQAQTVEDLAGILRGQGCRSRWLSLVPIQPDGPLPPLFCVHAQSGHVLFYRNLARRLDRGQPFYALQSVGLDGAHAPLTRVEDMAAHYIAEIRSIRPEGPYLLAGFCLGAYIAFEIARQLKASRQEVAFLGIFETSGEWRLAGSFLDGIVYHRQRIAGMGVRGRVGYFLKRLQYRMDRTKLIVVRLAVRALAATRLSTPARLAELALLDLNIRANHDYRPACYDGRVDYFAGKEAFPGDPAAFWRGVALQGVVVHPVPGAGAALFHDPHAASLAAALETALHEVRGASHSRAAAVTDDAA